MSKFRVVLISPPGYVHSEALREVAETVKYGLRGLGHEAEIDSGFTTGATHIVLCSHLLSSRCELPQGTILYNFEQMGAPNLESMMSLARRYTVWDYSPRNIRQWPIRIRALHVPLGYVPELKRIEPAANQDIDVLFYGSVNARRRELLQQLHRSGLKLLSVFGTYGAERDQLIARSKVVLNMHFYDSQVFEVVRVSYLLANSKAVVAECNQDTEIDDDLRPAVVAAPYTGLRYACIDLVRNPNLRREFETRGHEIFCKRNEKEILREALEKTYVHNSTEIGRDAANAATLAKCW